MLGEDADIADVFIDAVAALDLEEKAAQAIGRDVALNILGIKAVAGLVDTVFADIRSEDLQRHGHSSAIAQEFEQGDGHRVGLFAGGTARDPNADGLRFGCGA